MTFNVESDLDAQTSHVERSSASSWVRTSELKPRDAVGLKLMPACVGKNSTDESEAIGRVGGRRTAAGPDGVHISGTPWRKVTKMISRHQFALTPAHAFTDFRSQGQTTKKVIADIGTPPSGKLTPFNAYVALPRSRERCCVRLMKDCLRTHPNKHVRKEDERLSRLDEEIAEWWAKVYTPNKFVGIFRTKGPE